MDYFFWDEILGRPSLMDEAADVSDAEDVPTLPEGVASVIITVYTPAPPPVHHK
jgi:hypothetical protein